MASSECGVSCNVVDRTPGPLYKTADFFQIKFLIAFLDENSPLRLNFSLRFVYKGPIDKSALIQLMSCLVWSRWQANTRTNDDDAHGY